MINYFYSRFVKYFIKQKIHTKSGADCEKLVNRILSHQRIMPIHLGVGIKLLSIILYFVLLILGIFSKTNYIGLITNSSNSLFFYFKNIIRFHDSIFFISNINEQIVNQKLIHKIPSNIDNLDFIIIGSGPGGSVCGKRLTEKGLRVFMIEEGNDSQKITSYSQNEMLNSYKNGGLTATIGENNIAYVEGRTLGGGSQINSGLYHRIAKKTFNEWKSKFEFSDFNYDELEKYFLLIERDLKISYFPDNKISKASCKLDIGANKLGWKSEEVPRWVDYNCSEDINGKRMTMSQTYINEYLINGGELVTNSKVVSIDKIKNKWKVKYSQNNKIYSVFSANVIISAGAIGSPYILQANHLSPKAGKNFQLHPTLKVVAEFEEEVNDINYSVGVHQVKEFAPKITFGCSISTPPFIKMGMRRFPSDLLRIDKDWKKMAVYYVSIIPEGNGTINKLPFINEPFVRFNLTKQDKLNLVTGLNNLNKLLFSSGAKKIYSGTGHKIDNQDPREIGIENFKDFELSTVHLFSSCPSGENKDKCVVNSYGKVFNQKGLYVLDSSILPSAPGINPQGTVMSLAYRNIDKIISKL